jgi:hypothetical protein
MEFDPLPKAPDAPELESAPELAHDTVPKLELELDPEPDMEFDPLLDALVLEPTPEFALDIEPDLELEPLPEAPNAPAPKAQKAWVSTNEKKVDASNNNMNGQTRH